MVLLKKSARKISVDITIGKPSQSAILKVVPSWLMGVRTTAWNKVKEDTTRRPQGLVPRHKETAAHETEPTGHVSEIGEA